MIKLTEIFDCIRIVNLAERSDRRQETTDELSKLGVQVGINNVQFFPAHRPKESAGFPNIGARGCFLSHLDILREAQKNSVNQLLILEDDVDFYGGTLDRLTNLMPRLNHIEWDILYLGHHLELQSDESLVEIVYDMPIQTTHSYAIKKNTLPRLINFLELVLTRPPGHPMGGPMHVDGAISTFRMQNEDIRTWVITKPICYQRPSKTDIHANQFYDRMIILKTIVRLFRKLKRKAKVR